MTVQRLHANDAYTFAPYNAYFNDYYTLDGDGSIAGQTVQDDMFYYFPRKQAEELLAARDDDDAGVLDRLESAYAAYVRARCLDVPDGAGYDAIDKELAALVKERKLRDDDIDGRRALVRSWLNEHCRYSADAETPDDTDPLLYFLSESHTGSSTQFASAAVLLCRHGGAARPICGRLRRTAKSVYRCPGDGSCRAVLQDDNAHAWAEIYLSGQGWTPLEVTPGMTAELTEGELAAMPHRQGKMPQTVIHPCSRGRRPTPLPKRRKVSRFCGCCLRFCCCSSWPWHFCAVQGAHLCRPYRQNFVRSIARCGAAGWRRRCPLTKRHLRNFCKRIARRRTVKPCSTCWMPYRRAQFAPDPCTAETAQEIQTLCRKLRKKLCRRTV